MLTDLSTGLVDQSADHGSKGLDEGSPSRFRLGFLARATVERVRGVPHRNVPQRLTPGYFGAFHYHAINDPVESGDKRWKKRFDTFVPPFTW